MSLGPGTLPSPPGSVHKDADTAGPKVPVSEIGPVARAGCVWKVLSVFQDTSDKEVVKHAVGDGTGGTKVDRHCFIFICGECWLAALAHVNSAESSLDL